MGIPAKGQVVIIPFPFSDLSRSKLRHALIIAAGKGDWILAQITSKEYSDSNAIPVHPDDFESGGLQIESYVRPAKLFTANDRLFRESVGGLNASKMDQIIESIVTIIKKN